MKEEFVHQAKHIQRRLFTGKFLVFLVCLGISTFLWSVIRQSAVHNQGIPCHLKFVNYPIGKVLVNQPDTVVFLKIQSGSMFAFTNPVKKNILVDLSRLSITPNGQYYESYLTALDLRTFIGEQTHFSGTISFLTPDFISFRYEQAISKKVPVKLNLDCRLEKQYHIYGGMVINPDSVIVSGSSVALSSIHYVETEKKRLRHLKNSCSIIIPLIKNKSSYRMQYSRDFVKVDIPVEKFTEIVMPIPIEINNNYKKYESIKLFPSEASVTCLVALKDYKLLKSSNFNITVDGGGIGKATKLPVKLSTVPDFVKVVRIEPANVEYLIIK